jgi:hypothetical protein
VAGRYVRGNAWWWRQLRSGGRRICDCRARVTVIRGNIAPATKTISVERAESRELPSTSKATECELLIVEMLVGDHDHSIVVGAHDNSHRRPPCMPLPASAGEANAISAGPRIAKITNARMSRLRGPSLSS